MLGQMNSLLNKTYDIRKPSIHFKALKYGNQQFAGSGRKSWRFIVTKTNLKGAFLLADFSGA
ncbi:hypothetical protein AM592_21355 [Bacillus gobiensis]|uniref:Uncharacterized protein n=1 Tax=Bacillus gobiensis TaxID=1441095 RepID=A0A0M4FMV0_9BACI|nr:hypothetical protein AM592_21355 [Bacillus gobiensis]